MGDFVRHRFESIHEVLLERAGEKLGTIRVSAEVHLRESWDHLKGDGSFPTEPAGAHNRRIVADRTGYSVSGTAWGRSLAQMDDPLPEPIPAIVAGLREHGGLEGIPYEDERFPAAFAEHVQAHGLAATFCETGRATLL